MNDFEDRRREDSWLSTRELANALDVSVEWARRELTRRIPPDAKRKIGREWRFYGPVALRVLLIPDVRRELIEEVEKAERRQASAAVGNDDEFLSIL